MQQWLLLAVAVLGGSALGLGAFTFSYAKGYSYLQDEPAACANCHIMEDLQLARAIGDAAAGGAGGENLALARRYHRRAQFYTDFVEAENSMGFHADQEAVRILGKAVDFARLGLAAALGRPLPETPKALRPPPQAVVPDVGTRPDGR